MTAPTEDTPTPGLKALNNMLADGKVGKQNWPDDKTLKAADEWLGHVPQEQLREAMLKLGRMLYNAGVFKQKIDDSSTKTIEAHISEMLALFTKGQLQLVNELENDRAIFKLLHEYADKIIQDHDNWSGRNNIPTITGLYARKIMGAVNTELQHKKQELERGKNG